MESERKECLVEGTAKYKGLEREGTWRVSGPEGKLREWEGSGMGWREVQELLEAQEMTEACNCPRIIHLGDQI